MSKKNIKVPEFEITVGGEEYTFRLDFLALEKFEEKIENEGKMPIQVFNEFLQGKKLYKNIIKILSCSCEEKDLTEEEIARGLPFNLETMQLVDEIATSLVRNVMVEKDSNEKGNNEEKN